MKYSSPNFSTHPFFLLSIVIFFVLFLGYFGNKQNRNQATLISNLSTNHTILTNQIILPAPIILTNGVFSTNLHLISVFVGSIRTMQIRADNFSFKDSVLSCHALDRNFYIIGSIHSIVIEEIKSGQDPVTFYLNKPSPEKQKDNLNEKLQRIYSY